jgi:transposase
LNTDRKLACQAIHLPTSYIMTTSVNISAGLDIHNKFVLATILWSAGQILQERFERTKDGLHALKLWITSHKCEVVACESTSDFWVPIYELINGTIPVIVGNARDIKALSHKKTDKVDSEMIARLALHGMIQPSRIFCGKHREFRKILRLRHRLVEKRTSFKYQVKGILNTEMIRLSSILSDIFGKSGMMLLTGIINGMQLKDIIPILPKRTQEKRDVIIKVLEDSISKPALFQIKVLLDVIRCLDEQELQLKKAALNYAYENYPREMEILMSVPGIGEVGAATLIAEIGDIRDFASGDKLAGWLGMVPNVYQSAGKLRTGSITKRGSVHARWILAEIAHAAARCRCNSFRMFYERKSEIIGKAKATIALARKMITVIWHLLTNNERYEDPVFPEKKTQTKSKVMIPMEVSLEQLLEIIAKADILIKAPDPDIL